jgi:hypothetical protein
MDVICNKKKIATFCIAQDEKWELEAVTNCADVL